MGYIKLILMRTNIRDNSVAGHKRASKGPFMLDGNRVFLTAFHCHLITLVQSTSEPHSH